MDASDLLSAVVGGLLVVAGQYIAHLLAERAKREERAEAAKDRIAALTLEVVNWLQIDQQVVIQNAGVKAPPMASAHPIYSLAAQIRRSQPMLTPAAKQLMDDFRDYYQATRVLQPPSTTSAISSHVVNVGTIANRMTMNLNVIIEAVATP